MASYALSAAADRDIEEIARWSIGPWGVERAQSYILDLHRVFDLLSRFPSMGGDVSTLRPGYFRFEHESHVIFCQIGEPGIFIVRVLHHRQQPRSYL